MKLTSSHISPQEKADLLIRLFKNREVNQSGCWLWTGCLNVYGYGVMGHKNRQVHTHRLGYFIFRGDIPDSATGLQLDHLCGVRACFHPWHLEIVTIRTNLLRSKKSAAGQNSAKTHCIRGHLLAGDNIRVKNGERICLACRRFYNNRIYKKRYSKEANGGVCLQTIQKRQHLK
jgi:hypothetical protein